MPTFPSRDWMQDFCDQLRAHPEVERVATALDGTYRFVIEPAGPLDERHVYDVRIAPDPSIQLLDGEASAPTIEIVADHNRWRQLIEGKLDIAMAVMLRRVKVRGDISRLVGRMGDTRPLTDALGQVRTDWLDA